MSSYPYHLDRPPQLTGRVRYRSTRFLGRQVLQVEFTRQYVTNMRRPPSESNVHKVAHWRDATVYDLIEPELRWLRGEPPARPVPPKPPTTGSGVRRAPCQRCGGTRTIRCEMAYHGERSEFWDEPCPDCAVPPPPPDMTSAERAAQRTPTVASLLLVPGVVTAEMARRMAAQHLQAQRPSYPWMEGC